MITGRRRSAIDGEVFHWFIARTADYHTTGYRGILFTLALWTRHLHRFALFTGRTMDFVFNTVSPVRFYRRLGSNFYQFRR